MVFDYWLAGIVTAGLLIYLTYALLRPVQPSRQRRQNSRTQAAREELGSTGVGNGVALPHARLVGLKTPFSLFARLRRAIDFEAIDDQPVDLVFLLLLPESENGEQLNALACAARALRDPEVLKQIRGAADPDALFRAIVGPGTYV
jgi:K+-transporting ATPase KdpF subunit